MDELVVALRNNQISLEEKTERVAHTLNKDGPAALRRAVLEVLASPNDLEKPLISLLLMTFRKWSLAEDAAILDELANHPDPTIASLARMVIDDVVRKAASKLRHGTV